MAKMKWFDWIAYLLLVIGGLNWGLVSLSYFITPLNFNLVTWLSFGQMWLENLIYLLVGIVGFYGLWIVFKINKK